MKGISILDFGLSIGGGRWSAVTRAPSNTRAQPEATSLRACNVSLAYFDGDTTNYAVSQVSLELPARGFIGVMGPSGSGKSSLLYLLSGLKRPTSGEVEFRGMGYSCLSERALTQLRRECFGFVFQQPFLLNYLTVRENVLAAAPNKDTTAMARVERLFEALQIAHLAEKFPYHLSGGERQRVCVARAMINRPEVIFADEPTASLDHKNGHMVIDLLAGYRDSGLVIVVTHDPEMVAGADQVFHMRDGILEG
jgi:putative ABC transport system ATP-binding protein